MATGGRAMIEQLLVNLQRRQEVDAEENHKAFAALHDIVDKLGSTVVDLSKSSLESVHGEALASSWNRDPGQH